MQMNPVVQTGEAVKLLPDRRGDAVRFLRSDNKAEPVEPSAVT